MTKKIHAGITGGIGSGKSFVSNILKKLGYPVYDADSEAKNLMTADKEVIKQIISLFGEAAYTERGELNRQYISKIVFEDNEKLSALNAIVHPAVGRHYLQWAKHETSTILFKEAALLIEAGSYKQSDVLIVVSAPEEIRIQRVMERDRVPKEAVIARMKNQMPQEEKESYADIIIVNDGVEPLVPQIMQALITIKEA